jgi:hypothetical protein
MTKMVAGKSGLPRTPPVKSSHRYVLDNMAEISDAEISEYETTGFVVLKKRVDPVLVREARGTVAEKVQETCRTWRNDRIFVTVCENPNWPPECQTLYEAVEASI